MRSRHSGALGEMLALAARGCGAALSSRHRRSPPHLAPRSLGGCDAPDCVVPLCRMHHRAYDLGEFELLPYLEPQWRIEVAHAVLHLGLIGAVRRLAPGRR
jgi:hypothetical protein